MSHPITRPELFMIDDDLYWACDSAWEDIDATFADMMELGIRLAIARGWATAVTAETIWYNHAVGFYRKSRCRRAKLVTPSQSNLSETLLIEEIDHILEWHSAASTDWGRWLPGTTKIDRKRYRLIRKLNLLRDKLIQQRELTLARSSDPR